MSTVTIRRLKASELFGGCRRSQLAKIDHLGTTTVVPAGTTLCVEGTPGEEFFVLVDGLVDVRNSTGALALLRSGAWFGETALLSGDRRRATVCTRSESMLLVYNRREFNALLSIAPHVRERLQRSAVHVVEGAPPTRLAWYQPLPAVLPFRMTCAR